MISERIYQLADKAAASSSTKVGSTTRGGFLRRVAAVGAAAAAGPVAFLKSPSPAWASCTGCPNPSCSAGSLCCSVINSTFCCTLGYGNVGCPSFTGACGWWYCNNGPQVGIRYIDCCKACSCAECTCGACNQRRSCCNGSYGNCTGGSGQVYCRLTKRTNPGVCNNIVTGSCDAPPACAAV